MSCIRAPRSQLLSRRWVILGGASAFLAGCAGRPDYAPRPDLEALAQAPVVSPPPPDGILVFRIAAGKLTQTNGQTICDARSGRGIHMNNPTSFSQKDEDPIPPGWWEITSESYGKNIKRNVMWLAPAPDPQSGEMTDAMDRQELCLHELFFDQVINGIRYPDEEFTSGCVGVGRQAWDTLRLWRQAEKIRRLHVIPA